MNSRPMNQTREHRGSPWGSPCVAPASRRGCPVGCPFRGVTTAIAAAVFALAPGATLAQVPDSVPVVRQQARQWYQDAKFGMFIHWGGLQSARTGRVGDAEP